MAYEYIEHQFYEYIIVQQACTHKHINIATACREMGVTPKELTEYLTEDFGTTFNEVVHAYRIEEAKELWDKSGKTPIRKIARAVGYGNSVAFLLNFLKH